MKCFIICCITSGLLFARPVTQVDLAAINQSIEDLDVKKVAQLIQHVSKSKRMAIYDTPISVQVLIGFGEHKTWIPSNCSPRDRITRLKNLRMIPFRQAGEKFEALFLYDEGL